MRKYIWFNHNYDHFLHSISISLLKVGYKAGDVVMNGGQCEGKERTLGTMYECRLEGDDRRVRARTSRVGEDMRSRVRVRVCGQG